MRICTAEISRIRENEIGWVEMRSLNVNGEAIVYGLDELTKEEVAIVEERNAKNVDSKEIN
jgi:hypothetical protein